MAAGFPTAKSELRSLPGIGRYTAGAVLSIAFQKPVPLVDGNVMRVFSRYFGIRKDIALPRRRRSSGRWRKNSSRKSVPATTTRP